MSYILLIEDNQENADLMTQLLHSIGLEVKHFPSGFAGVRQARQERPDLILLDFNLPDIDGRNLVLVLKQATRNVNPPPIVAVTARSGSLEMALAERFGCSAFIAKPFDPERFLDVVQHLLPPQ